MDVARPPAKGTPSSPVEVWRVALTADWTFARRWRLAAQLGSEFDRHPGRTRPPALARAAAWPRDAAFRDRLGLWYEKRRH
jgi:hypothetical protein